MVARRSGRGYDSPNDRNTSYRNYSRSSRGSSRYDSRRSGATSSRASRIGSHARPSTRAPYHDTFYEDLLTDGVFDNAADGFEYEENAASYETYHGHNARRYDDSSSYDDDDDYANYEERSFSSARHSRSAYSRDRYGSGAVSHSRRGTSHRSAESRVENGHSGNHADRYSSQHAADRYRTPTKKRSGLGLKTKVLVALVFVLVLIGGGMFAYITGISNNLQRGVDDDLRNALVKTDMANEPFYMLLLGTDGSLERDATGDFGGNYRSDSIMLVRIDPVEKKAALVSISRDILVDLGEYGEQKLNAAFGLGGPALTVQAVSKLTGVDISHYAQVDFDGFSDLVDALGGVTVNVPVDIDDSDAGGRVSAGEQLLNGEKALILCRSRNTYSETASQPDAMRAANQRLVMSALAHKLLDADIATIANSVQALSEFVTTDLSLNDIIGLAQAMKGIDSSTDIYTAMLPSKSALVKDMSVDYIDKEAWNKMLKRFQEGLPPTEEAEIDELTGTILAYTGSDIDLSTGSKYATVTVKNGTDLQGLANQTRNVLLSYGFKNVVIGDVNANYDYPHTLIIYEKDNAEYGAKQIAKIIEQGKVIKNNGQYLMSDSDYLIIIGEDWV